MITVMTIGCLVIIILMMMMMAILAIDGNVGIDGNDGNDGTDDNDGYVSNGDNDDIDDDDGYESNDDNVSNDDIDDDNDTWRCSKSLMQTTQTVCSQSSPLVSLVYLVRMMIIIMTTMMMMMANMVTAMILRMEVCSKSQYLFCFGNKSNRKHHHDNQHRVYDNYHHNQDRTYDNHEGQWKDLGRKFGHTIQSLNPH